MQLILASTSPYRKSLLEKFRIPFSCHAPHTDESQLEGETADMLVSRLARAKAESVANMLTEPGLVIGSDQVASLDGEIIGKPLNHNVAVEQLRRASGRLVRFYTGLCLFNSESKTCQLQIETFDVQFRQLSAEQIEAYLQKEQPYQCAGSFMSEGLGICLFERLSGRDPNSLVGLPLIALTEMLQQAGIDPLCIGD
ncbi:Maf family protein [Bowmanella yangjiangensis]|uniref:7-methyl-GTP pyrophosphatase n=1 Tax=Bowmanella yangjiangensis TaxID=2811230 RepID=A0ABS3CU40_9ALTE|nr:nucleoside triphosphate pyrophosphatase [Bowmanella yangjiangensis]MBN7820632.1 septum formation inhibitor Maf [Bowmanella yangjiangensis]